MNSGVYITPERLDAFMFSNPLDPTKLVVVYAQKLNRTNFIDFKGVAAGVSYDVYLLAIAICCLLMLLFVFIEFLMPTNTFKCFISLYVSVGKIFRT
jgi:hypothetical protein